MAEHGEPTDKRRAPFVMMEVSVLRDPTLTPLAKLLYGLLKSYGPGRIFPSHETLAEALGVTRRTIAQRLQELRQHGLVDWVQTGRSNLYQINSPGCASQDTPDVHPETHQTCPPQHVRCAPGDTRSRSIDPHPTIHRGAPACPSLPVSSSKEIDRNATKPPGQPRQKARAKIPPAVAAFRRATGRYPPKPLYGDIAQAVGDDADDLAFWHDICKAWVGRGWNPSNVEGMLDRYGRREMPRVPGSPASNGNRRPAAGRRRRRDEQHSYTSSQRDALWARYKDRYLALVDRGLKPNLHSAAIAKKLDLTSEEAHILCAAYSAWQSFQEPPLDPSVLDEDT